ncbi:hypothetical protein LK542_16240 [Massilia sp. IC2-477]|uniref:hypothetical protein n=1 Tax=Massilia sp. IC2-477 TaxID=2887198 RepID=UPI001D0F4C50|nr:hypothetical protein [Massilia sp. IC2-477]MCC2957167.1 hypothetical protein [Massilia sp. IC2-477]
MNISRLFAIAATGAVLLLTGCASTPMGVPQATIENTARLRSAQLAPARVGSFTLDTSKPAALDQSVSIRAASLNSPIGGSFAQYLGETLRVELAAAGLADPNAPTVISGTLLDSELDAAIGTGSGKLSARFVVKRNDTVRYDRTLSASATWESSFVGAVAIPLAAGQYQGLYRKLAGQLFDDPEFRKALAP